MANKPGMNTAPHAQTDRPETPNSAQTCAGTKGDIETLPAQLRDLPWLAQVAAVRIRTTYVWRFRGVLPQPACVIGGRPAWFKQDLVDFLVRTGRYIDPNWEAM